MRQVLKLILWSALLLIMGLGFAGFMVWCATVRTEDFYARAAFRSDSLFSAWIRPLRQVTGSHWGSLFRLTSLFGSILAVLKSIFEF